MYLQLHICCGIYLGIKSQIRLLRITYTKHDQHANCLLSASGCVIVIRTRGGATSEPRRSLPMKFLLVEAKFISDESAR